MIKGRVRDENKKPMDSVVVAYESKSLGTYTYTNADGYYSLTVPSDVTLSIIYAYPGNEKQTKNLKLAANDIRVIDVTMRQTNTLGGINVTASKSRFTAGNVTMLDPSKIPFIPGAVGGIESLIKIATGSHDELSSQYSVRGGNFDENLVYVDDFEIYRPFLVRTGQQEGLSFVNSDLVDNVNFSVGGFEARYGDKMSSVLDVSYKRPTEFAGSVSASLLGASLHLENGSKDNKWSYLIGARQKSNQYVLQAQPTQGVYNPSFSDVQAVVNYSVSDNWELEGIGNYARNRFTFYPETMTTSFGVEQQAYQLDVYYNGSEFDQFDSRFAGLSATYHRKSSKLRLKFLVSGFQTNEFETYDISGQYLFGLLQTDMGQKNFGQINTYLGAGTIQDFARNYLAVNVGNANVKGSYEAGRNFLQFGFGAGITSISDELHQWERRDSAGFTQPYYNNKLALSTFYNNSTDLNYVRLNGYLQDNLRFDSSSRFSLSGGLRFNYSYLNSELILSPRVQTTYKPAWVGDWVFKLSAGNYAQPPMFREMQNVTGSINTQLKAQQSDQVVLGTDHNFKMYNRPFKFTGEVYYKYLNNLDPYYYNNVQVEYTGKNDAVGYVYGGELRLYGDLVRDATSWISIGVMKAAQKITDSGSIAGYNKYFPLPSDQRFMVGMYFEDYIKNHKNYKVHLSLMYAKGLPVGPPFGHLYNDIYRLPDYKRVDIGFSALLLDETKKEHPIHSFFNNLKSVWASLEVFNLLDIQNTLSYTWIQDDTSQKIFAVPNRLTSRLLNFKLLFKF